jgi:hypothetical protein
MPVVNDEEVLGVFELFSGKVNAFGERDLSAVQRLSEMVGTAVRLAEATENLPEWLRTSAVSAPAVADAEVEEDKILETSDLEASAAPELVAEKLRVEDLVLDDAVLEEPRPALKVAPDASAEKTEIDNSVLEALTAFGESAGPEPLHPKTVSASPISGQGPSQKDEPPVIREAPAPLPAAPIASIAENVPAVAEGPKAVLPVAAQAKPPQAAIPENVATAAKAAKPRMEPVPAAESTPSKNQLFWSAALNPAANPGKPDADQSHVPPVLRNLHKCQACGFPVSTARVFCVECEEKKWRGQLKVPQAGPPRQSAVTAPVAAVEAAPKAEVRVFAAAAQSSAAGIPVPQRVSPTVVQTSSAGRTESRPAEPRAIPPTPDANSPGQATALDLVAQTSAGRSPEFVLSAGLQPSQSWFSANKYVLIALVVVGLATAAFFVLR